MSFIGKRGYAKKLGPLVLGTVENEICGECFKHCMENEKYFHEWNVYYPDWVNHKVLRVKLSTPSKSITIEELIKSNLDNNLGYNKEEIDIIYARLPKVSYLRIPSQDFEILTD